jgi:hypothetical protein
MGSTGDDEERSALVDRERSHACRYGFCELARDRRWGPGLEHAAAREDRPTDLQREQRVGAGPFRDPKQRGSREGVTKTGLQQMEQGGDAQRPKSDANQTIRRLHALEAQRHRRVTFAAHRDEQPDVVALEASHGEFERASRRPVEPLDVIDRDDQRTSLREAPQHAQETGGDRPTIERPAAGWLLERRDEERPALWIRQPVKNSSGDATEKIGQPGVCEVALRRCRCGAHDCNAAAGRRRERCLPEDRLADAARPAEDKSMGTLVR